MNIIQMIAGLFKRSNSVPAPMRLPTPITVHLHVAQHEEAKEIVMQKLNDSGLYDEATKDALKIGGGTQNTPNAKKSKRVNWSRARGQIATLAVGKSTHIYIPVAIQKKGASAASSTITRMCHELLGKGHYSVNRRPYGYMRVTRLA